ncbi:hypothetical protein KP509_10G040200 [Ceratopteris richardii]|uniref:PB1 domain-containing protein n=2 Tax=Ceratopteris richardii TaxID=49495 RepID=A0A8T2TUK0_CERRI|nr:hypothetical protein KP509_10G040200 [Ceratopteris richardii]
MRRADLPSLVPGSEATVLASPAYADSDVGSSPRSVGGTAPRPGSLTEEPPAAARWDDTTFARVKLMCSYGGRILPRPQDNQLRYVGGESRIAVVSRNITFSELVTKLSRMFKSSVIIKYQLPYEDLDALISVTSDEDLENMMEEYDRLQVAGNRGHGAPPTSARLRLFLFPFKPERSQTASLSEVMGNNYRHERWFAQTVDRFPVTSCIQSGVSSVVSDTPDYSFQASNVDALEEWAAAASYGNTSTEASTGSHGDGKQETPLSPTSIFGSLIQQTIPNSEITSAPGSPSPVKANPASVGSSSSASPTIMPLLSSATEFVSDGIRTPMSSKGFLGSGDSSGSLQEQKQQVDFEGLPASHRNIQYNTIGVEQLLPTGLMDDDDDDDVPQKVSARTSFAEVLESTEIPMVDANACRMIPQQSFGLMGDLTSEKQFLSQPVFDENQSTALLLAKDLDVLTLDERVQPHPILPHHVSFSASALVPPSDLSSQQPVLSKFGSDDNQKHQAIPISPDNGTHVSSEVVMTTQELFRLKEGDDRLSPHVGPFQNFPPSSRQQANLEVMLMPEALAVKSTRAVDTVQKVQVTTAPSVGLPSLIPPLVEEQAFEPVSDTFFQQSPVGISGSVISATSCTQQEPDIEAMAMIQSPSTSAGVDMNLLPRTAMPIRPANGMDVSHYAVHLQKPQGLVAQHAPAYSQARIVSPPLEPVQLANNISQTESLDLLLNNTVSVTANPSVGEGVRSSMYQQHELRNPQRQASTSGHGQRSMVVPPTNQLSSQLNMTNLNAPITTGITSQFRAVGHPLQRIAEGIPVQQTPLVGLVSESNVPSVLRQRTGVTPTAHTTAHYNYLIADQPIPQSTAMGGGLTYNAPSTVVKGIPVIATGTIPFTVANPFSDSMQAAASFPDVVDLPLSEQQHRRPIHNARGKNTGSDC